MSLCEWAALCHVLHTRVCTQVPLVVFTAPAVSLRTNTESLTDTERTLNNPFILLFEKTIVKYTDTQSFSLLPVFFLSLCDLRQLRRFKCILLPSSVHYYPSK